jgi:hypothetical protein
VTPRGGERLSGSASVLYICVGGGGSASGGAVICESCEAAAGIVIGVVEITISIVSIITIITITSTITTITAPITVPIFTANRMAPTAVLLLYCGAPS